ncbi:MULTISPECIES: hypothetical protein [Pseudomonas]|uniref:SWIM-type domain-containing protein n=1 Tax=Pseudomonas lutea TaxID=243924 RepID=A0A9X8MH25_9PSED|nr:MULTISPECIES: hypothetical protein [Pseudomonas]SER36149.1 hypothetical protein SAMN05216409_11840 [Pseudomonas lutea]
MPKIRPESLPPARNVRAQSIRAFAEEVRQRQSDQGREGNTLISPDEIAGDYSFSRALFTTLGGKPKIITADDLKTFTHNVRQLKNQAKSKRIYGGIRAKSVIDMSWKADRQRANREIHMANPTHYAAMTEGGGQGTSLVVHFYTNASADSEFTHHNVNVQFLDFGAVVASPVKSDKIIKQMTGGRLRFECSCPRHKYFFRYVATQAEYNYGRAELSFPKITNPGLSGVACKHALRVMQVILHSATFNAYAKRVVQKFRDDISHTKDIAKVADQRKMAEAMRKEDSRRRNIKTSSEKRAQRQAQPSYQRQLAARAAARAEVAKKPAAKAKIPDAKFIAMLRSAGFSEAQAQAALAAAKATT